MPEKAELSGGGDDDENNMTLAAAANSAKDENAVNHEIATLLLNLASRTSSSRPNDEKISAAASKAADVAMDLSIYAKSNSAEAQKQQQQQQQISSNSGGVFQSAAAAANGGGVCATNPYSLFPLSSVPALPSSYLLQNLLIG